MGKHLTIALLSISLWAVTLYTFAQVTTKSHSHKQKMSGQVKDEHISDTLGLADVFVFAKSRNQEIREGAYSVTVADMKNIATSVTNLSEFLSRSSGLNIRTEGGLGADYSLSINGMSGNSIRYFVDGVPMSALGSGLDLNNFPINTIDRIEVYKGVVPAHLGGDALGGAINIITKNNRKNHLDVSVGAGSFNTYRTDMNAQLYLGKTGILVRPQLSYDYSKNNYKMYGVELWNSTNKRYESTTRERFHDKYQSFQGQLDFGIEKKSWTDQFIVGFGYTDTQKQLQTGATQNIVIGSAEHNTSAWNIHARFRKSGFILPHLTATLTFDHTWDNSVTVDTALRRYDWNGEWKKTSRNEINGRARIMRHYKRPLTVGRANLSYSLAQNHALTLNYLLTRSGNERYDKAHEFYPIEEVQDLPATTNDVLEKHIIGLSYDQTLYNNSIVNSFFIKDYINHVDVEQEDISNITSSKDYIGHAVKNFWGYGFGSRYAIKDWIATKFSYERSVRLPQARELLGNGTYVYANFALHPETSHNFNLGAYGTVNIDNDNRIDYEATGFMRITKDYIRLRISEGDGTAQYENVNDVTTRGIEAEMKYIHKDWLQLTVNGSLQESLDVERTLANGNYNATYKNRIPNRPWMFGNAELTLTKRNVLSPSDRIRFNALYQYVHWYYLTWEAYGNKASKAKIPTQNVINAALTYSWMYERYNITLSCNNITNRICYDNYKLQKPGRNLMLKLTYKLK